MSAALARLMREPDLAPRLGGAAMLTFRDRLAGERSVGRGSGTAKRTR